MSTPPSPTHPLPCVITPRSPPRRRCSARVACFVSGVGGDTVFVVFVFGTRGTAGNDEQLAVIKKLIMQVPARLHAMSFSLYNKSGAETKRWFENT